MLNSFGGFVLSVFFASASASASAAECTQYETLVFSMIDEAKGFQQSQGFKDMGWSSRGPTNGWLDRMKRLQDGQVWPNNVQFVKKYGFGIVDVFQVADEYRTSGSLDSFYQDIEDSILSVTPCK
jgi:hypothetical protein